MANGSKIVHVQLKEPAEGQHEHYYFGSLTAIFSVLSSDDIGRTYDSLKMVSIEKKLGGYLETRKAIIRIGELVRQKGNRDNHNLERS